jgi:hypothetical protein
MRSLSVPTALWALVLQEKIFEIKGHFCRPCIAGLTILGGPIFGAKMFESEHGACF